jgi:uncharacterized membrane protein
VRAVVPILALVLYPLATHALVVLGRPQIALAGLAAVSLFFLTAGARVGWRWPGLYTLLAAAAAVSLAAGEPYALFLPPLLVNLALAALFAASLRRAAVPVVERFMHAEFPNGVPDELRPYARRLTWQWVAFFIAMAAISAALAAWAPLALWSLFANVLIYPLVASLFLLQHGWRRWRFPGVRGRFDPRTLWQMLPALSGPRGEGRRSP